MDKDGCGQPDFVSFLERRSRAKVLVGELLQNRAMTREEGGVPNCEFIPTKEIVGSNLRDLVSPAQALPLFALFFRPLAECRSSEG